MKVFCSNVPPSTQGYPRQADLPIAGESPDYKRHYVVHTCEPRFIAEFLEIRTGNAVLHQIVEIDPVPVGEVARLSIEAAEALAVWFNWWSEAQGG